MQGSDIGAQPPVTACRRHRAKIIFATVVACLVAAVAVTVVQLTDENAPGPEEDLGIWGAVGHKSLEYHLKQITVANGEATDTESPALIMKGLPSEADKGSSRFAVVTCPANETAGRPVPFSKVNASEICLMDIRHEDNTIGALWCHNTMPRDKVDSIGSNLKVIVHKRKPQERRQDAVDTGFDPNGPVRVHTQMKQSHGKQTLVLSYNKTDFLFEEDRSKITEQGIEVYAFEETAEVSKRGALQHSELQMRVMFMDKNQSERRGGTPEPYLPPLDMMAKVFVHLNATHEHTHEETHELKLSLEEHQEDFVDLTATLRPTPATEGPTQRPTGHPTQRPTGHPTQRPTGHPTQRPTQEPSQSPTLNPTYGPTELKTINKCNGGTQCVQSFQQTAAESTSTIVAGKVAIYGRSSDLILDLRTELSAPWLLSMNPSFGPRETWILKRTQANAHGTLGTLGVFTGPSNPTQYLATCVERPWVNNEPDVSRIPSGMYWLTAYQRPEACTEDCCNDAQKCQANERCERPWTTTGCPSHMVRLQGTQPRSGIMFHAGANPTHSTGCILCSFNGGASRTDAGGRWLNGDSRATSLMLVDRMLNNPDKDFLLVIQNVIPDNSDAEFSYHLRLGPRNLIQGNHGLNRLPRRSHFDKKEPSSTRRSLVTGQATLFQWLTWTPIGPLNGNVVAGYKVGTSTAATHSTLFFTPQAEIFVKVSLCLDIVVAKACAIVRGTFLSLRMPLQLGVGFDPTRNQPKVTIIMQLQFNAFKFLFGVQLSYRTVHISGCCGCCCRRDSRRACLEPAEYKQLEAMKARHWPMKSQPQCPALSSSRALQGRRIISCCIQCYVNIRFSWASFWLFKTESNGIAFTKTILEV